MEQKKPPAEKLWRVTGEGVFCPLCGQRAQPVSSHEVKQADHEQLGVQIIVVYQCDCDIGQQQK